MKWSILLVDADQRAAEAERLLFDEGYGVTWVRTGQAALASIKAHPPDLVIAELQLPDVDWTDFLERLREEAEGLSVLVMTTFTEVAGDLVESSRISADRVFRKPFGIDDFIKRVRRETDAIAAASSGPKAAV